MLRVAVFLALFATPALSLDFQIFDGRRDAGPAPLVLVLHGGGGSGGQLRRQTGFDSAARRAGVVAVYPSARFHLWNDGRFAATGNHRLAAKDDVGALRALIDDLVTRGLADPARVYVIGHSNGGGMAMRMACTYPELLAGIAVVATKALLDVPCRRDPPIPAVFFMGTADAVTPHQGDPDGRSGTPAADRARTASGEATIALWLKRNHCGSERRAETARGRETGIAVIRVEGRACAAPFRAFVIEGGGHTWPGAALFPRRAAARGEVRVTEISAAEEALRFWGLLR